jgi:hypothetical protein
MYPKIQNFQDLAHTVGLLRDLQIKLIPLVLWVIIINCEFTSIIINIII